tara:strand:+ start:1404 stop:1832 length:429 start_codon:yes stop_codon:yes gene_type:complete
MGHELLSFRVEGMSPAPQGSKRHVGGGRIIEASKRCKPWRYLVQQAAVQTGHPLITHPVEIHIKFYFARPKSHYRTNGHLKESAPIYHSIVPDLSKIMRSTEDAIVDAGLLIDDSRISAAKISKVYCMSDERPGALISIRTL